MPVVSRVVSGLLADGLVTEAPAGSGAMGRPRVGLSPARAAGVAASVRLEGGLVEVRVVGPDKEVVTQVSQEYHGRLRPQVLAKVTRQALDAVDVPCIGLCVSAPGVVREDGSVVQAPALGWTKPVEVAQLLTKELSCPVHVENDVNLMVRAEQEIEPTCNELALVYVGRRGIGLGIISSGRVLSGHRGASGEIGRLPASLTEPSVEAVEDTHSTDDMAARLRAMGVNPGKDPIATLMALDPEHPAQAIRDEVERVVERLIGVASIVLDPELVVLGGSARQLYEGRQKELTRRLAEWLPTVPRVRLSALGPEEAHAAAEEVCWEAHLSAGI